MTDADLSPSSAASTRAPASAARRWLKFGVKLVGTVGLLALTAWLVDLDQAIDRLASVEASWLLAGVAVSIPQYVASAGRWRFVAGRLGLDIGWGRAVREYYLATFINQVLPGGITGHVVRAVRHGRAGRKGSGSAAAEAVVFERASGQIVLWMTALASVPIWMGVVTADWEPWVLAIAAILALAVLASRIAWIRHSRWAQAILRFGEDGRRALWERGAVWIHGPLSLVVVATYIGGFVFAALAIGAPLDVVAAIQIVPFVLVASTLPVSISGWGVREASAAALYGLAGLSGADGAATSIVWGLVSLVSALPGAIFVFAGSSSAEESQAPEGGPEGTPSS